MVGAFNEFLCFEQKRFAMPREVDKKWLELDVLQKALEALSDEGHLEQQSLDDARNSIKTFIQYNSVEAEQHELTELGSKALMRCVVYAYAVGVFERKGELCGPLARLFAWFVRQTDAETQRDFWDVLLFSRQYDASKLRVVDVTTGKYKKRETQSKEEPDLGILLDLLSVPQCTGQEIDAIVALIEMALHEIRTHIVQPGSSSDAGEHDMVQKALKKIACSAELLTLFLNPLVINSISRWQLPSQSCLEISVEEMTQLMWSDERQDRDCYCVIGPRKRPDDLIVDALKSLSFSDDVANLISGLSDAYVSSSDFAKKQLYDKILNTIFFSENNMTFRALCFSLQNKEIKNNSLMLDMLSYLFESSFLFGELTALGIGDFYTFVSICASNICHSFPRCFFDTWYRCIKSPQPGNNKDKVWRFERLSLTGLFFSDEVALIPATNLNVEVFQSIGSLFLFTDLDPDLAHLKQETKDLFSSALESFSHYCHNIADFCVFPCLLNLALENGGRFCMPLQKSCSMEMILRWTKRPKVDDVRTLVDLFLDHDDDKGTWLRLALSWLMKSANGQQALQDAAIDELTWAEVRDRILNLMRVPEGQSIETVLCLTRLMHLLLNLYPESTVPALELTAHGIVTFEMPDDEFDLLMGAMTRDMHQSDAAVKEMLSAAFEACLAKESLRDITFLDMLLSFVKRQSEEDKRALCSIINQLLHKVFDLLEKDKDHIQKESLMKLVYLGIEGRTTEADTAADVSQDMSLQPFFSATFPEGKTVQIDTASLDGVRKMARVLGHQQLKLTSASLRREILSPSDAEERKESAGDHPSKKATSLIKTVTTEENILKIEEVVMHDRPVLLYGASGVGKTATLRELADRKGIELVRLNMSSNLTPEDFLAKTSFDSSGQIVLDVQPFARSFEKGNWVLIDEMNLAEESTLKVVVDALENGKIVLCDRSCALTPPRVLKKHPNFRLFATQNPWQAGKRERMSSAFFSQFSVLHFKELPKEEWELIVQSTLRRHFRSTEMDLIRAVARKMTDFHWNVREAIQSKSCETGSHTVITNRELLMWTAMISTAEHLPKQDADLGNYAWLIYGCRFREDGRQLVRDVLNENGLSVSQQNVSSDTSVTNINRMIQAYAAMRSNDIQRLRLDAEAFWKRHFSAKAPLHGSDKRTIEQCMSTHGDVSEAVLDPDFMQRHGVYTSFSEFWLVQWIADALQKGCLSSGSPEKLGQLGAEIYCSAFRKDEARMVILDIFAKNWNIDRDSMNLQSFDVPEMPVVLNDHTCELLTVLVNALQSEQPILIEGCAGSGKSCLAKTVAFLLRNRYEQVTLTVESEPSVMLGEHLPKENSREDVSIEWRDGPLTRSFKEGTVCIVDNIGQAEAVLQERINPVLESPKVLCLSEKGETKSHHCRILSDGSVSKTPGPAKGFQFIATYTPKGVASRGYDSTSNELTAALSNRFVAVHVDDPGQLPDSQFTSVLHSILQCSLCDAHRQQHADDICDYCLRVRSFLDRQGRGRSSFKQFVTFLDIVTNLMVQCPKTNAKDCLHCALMAAFVFRIRDSQQRNALLDHMGCPSDVLSTLQLRESVEVDSELVLTPSREAYADAVLLGVCTNKPVLLEGKPAVGKTALVSGLRMFRGRRNRVTILSNSDTTTLQDYFGTWMPEKAGFRYSKGVLVQAMEKGDWFVADEFNLAPLSVAAALMPFLEGSRVVQIPGTGMTISVHPQFRFFATQNPFHGGGDGRKLLPITVRNRFLEVEVDNFPQDEFADIIYKRFQKEEYQDIVSKTDAEHLSRLYFAASGVFRLTMRDLIKMVRRFKLLQAENTEGKTSWAAVVMSLLNPLVSTKDEEVQLLSLIRKAFGDKAEDIARSCMEKNIQETSHGLLLFQGPLRVSFSGYRLSRSRLWKHGNAEKLPPKIFQDRLVDLAFAMKAKEPVLLYGESSFKTELIRTWLEISQMEDKAQMIHLTSDSEATELIGQMHLASIVEVLEMLLSIGNFILKEIEGILAEGKILRRREYCIRRLDCSHDLPRRVQALIETLRGKSENLCSGQSFTTVDVTESVLCESEASIYRSSRTDGGESYVDSSSEDTAWGVSDSEDDGADQSEDELTQAANASKQHRSAEVDLKIRVASELIEEPEHSAFESVRETAIEIIDLLRVVSDGHLPIALKRAVRRMEHMCAFMSSADCIKSQGCFVFRDGPFVNAITLKHVCVIEDYDRCPQSVTERLNSALEVDPTFSIPEDASLSEIGVERLEIPERGYAFIATAHLVSSAAKPRISEATKSRITQIHIPAYSKEDIMTIVDAELFRDLKNDYHQVAPPLMNAIQSIRSEAMGETDEHPSADFRRILRWVSFVTHHPRETVPIERIILLGAKYFYLTGLPPKKQEKILLTHFSDDVREWKDMPTAVEPAGAHRAFTFGMSIEDRRDKGDRLVRLHGVGLTLSIPCLPESHTAECHEWRPSLHPTPTVMDNAARIFASISTKTPLLLEGPPGIGKVTECNGVP